MRITISVFILVLLVAGAGADTITLHPTGNGYSTQGTPVPAGAGTNWDRVNDQSGNAATGAPAVNDGDSSYVNMATNAWYDSYTLAASNIPAGSTVTGLDVHGVVRNSGLGNSAFRLFYRVNGTNTLGAATQFNSSTWTDRPNNFTGLNLAESAWSTLEIGITPTDANPDVYITQIYVIVTYTPPANSTTVGVVAASSSGCNSIAVTAPYADDFNANNTLSYRYRTPSGTGAWTAPTNLSHSASPYSFTIPGLTHGATYDVEVTYSDTNGVAGTNPQTVSNILVGPNCTGAGTVTADQTSGATPSIAVTAPYTSDNNADNTLSYRYRTPSGTGAWTAPTNLPHSATPYSFTISGLTCGDSYDMEVTYNDADGIGSGTQTQTVSNIVLTNCTTTGSPSASVDSCNQITASAPFSNDANTNGTTTFERGPDIAGPWTSACSNVTGSSPRTCVDNGVSASSTYYYRVTYSDADGVSGTFQQTIGPYVTPSCAVPPVTTGVPTATVNSCTQITVNAPYTNDTNGNSATTVEYNTTDSWPGTIACNALSGASPRVCGVSPLSNNTPYYFRVTFSDPDGVNGANPQVIGPFTTYDCKVTAQAASASVDSCSQITVSAPFSGDWDNDSTTRVERQTDCSGGWAIICNSISGGSPRTCADSTLSASTNYCYRVTFTDSDGINGTNPQTIGPYATPACVANDTTVTGASATAAACKQITVSTTFTGDGDEDGSTKVEYNTSDSWPGTTACAAVNGSSPRQCLITNLANPPTQYWVRITYTDADGVSGTNPWVLGPVNLPACGADQVPPTVLVVSPTKDAILGGTDRIKVQVYDAGGLAITDPVQWSVDGGSYSTSVSVNANYNCGSNCSIYEFDLNTTSLTNGNHYLTMKVTDAQGNEAQSTWAIKVNNTGASAAGSGMILRRTQGSQMCLDCHNLNTHSSQSAGTKYGNWAFDCFICHTPHRTTNIYLVRETLRTPNSGNKTVLFRVDDKSGGTNPQNSYLGAFTVDANATPTDDGICEVCHTKTTHYRNDNSGGDHTHNRSTRCISCHQHSKGFAGAACNDCHKAPPTVGKHGKHDEVGPVPTSYATVASHATSAQYGFPCAKCHSGSHMNDTHAGTVGDPYQVEAAFDNTADPKNPSGAYSQKYPDATDQGTDTTKYWSWTSSVAGTDGRCSSLYCHSNAAPAGGGTNSYATVQWNQAAVLSCTSCHATTGRDDTGALTDLSQKHGKHIKATTYSFTCDECHSATMADDSSNTLGNKVNHVDGTKTWAFSTTATAATIDQSVGNYSAGSCSGLYCHSQGATTTGPFPAPNSSPAWTTGTTTCETCHSGNAAATTKMNTYAHAAHMNQASYLGSNFMCYRCHQDTVSSSSDTAINTYSFHVNGARNVNMFDGGSYAAWACSNTYCHSNGTETNDYVNPPNWNSGSTLTNDCKRCHGTEVGSIAGEPRYANNTGSFDTRNSHLVAEHVSAVTDCVKCHATTVDSSGNLVAAGTHLNQTREVSNATFTASYSEATETCTNVVCHTSGSPVWGNTYNCRDCHLKSGAGDQDVDDFTWDNIFGDGVGTAAVIDGEDWRSYGHGRYSTDGNYQESANTAANLDANGTQDGCSYCHSATVAHNAASNPFRLVNIGAGSTVAEKNGVCTACHGSAGYDPPGAIPAKDSTKDIDAWHYGADHSGTGDGGMFCWDCHDPHGDYNYGSTQRIAYMVHEQPGQDHAGSTGWGVPSTQAPVPDFRNDRDATAGFAWGDYVSNSLVSGTYRGVCQVCHTNTNVNNFRQTLYNATHNNTGNPRCTASCHTHDQPPSDAFKGAGDCITCHGSRQGSIPRAAVVGAAAGSEGDDFIRKSRHVSDGTTTAIVTNFDCILCHAEGDVTSSGTNIKTIAANHGGDSGTTTVELRNVDSAGGTGIAANWPGKRLAAFTATTAQRDAMDTFCMNCHDSGGATGVVVNKNNPADGMTVGPTGAQALDPFNVNDTFQNANESNATGQTPQSIGDWRKNTNARVIDVKSQFNSTNQIGKLWASHHNLNQYTKRYTTRNTTAWPNAAWTTYTTKEGQNIQTAGETAGLHCSDCHLNEVNAHGARNSWYMLSDSSGNDAVFTNSGVTTSTDICVKCHAASTYGEGNTSTSSRVTGHNQSGARCNNFAVNDKDAFARLGSIAGTGAGQADQLQCLGCHGGLAPGMIHGTNSTYNPGNSGSWTSKRYRFLGFGGSMRWYTPNGTTTGTDASWEGTSAPGCYTIGSVDTWGACTQHGSIRTDGSFVSNRSRPLEY